MNIIISPYAQKLRPPKEKETNAKNYPYWPELLELLKGHEILQLGVQGEKPLITNCKFNFPLQSIERFVKDCDFFISIDSFLPHMAYYLGKRGVVLWGQSDPNIFGYDNNLNILKDRKYLRPDQFNIWEPVKYNPDAFVKAKDAYYLIKNRYNL